MPQDNSNNLRKLAKRKKQPKIPTADEEALEAPTIDPVMFAALAGTMGPMAAAKQLIQQIGVNELFQGVPEGVKRLSQYLPRASTQDMREGGSLAAMAQEQAGNDIRPANPENWGGMIRDMAPNSKAADKLASVLDKLTKMPETAEEERYMKEAIDKLIESGQWAERMKPPL